MLDEKNKITTANLGKELNSALASRVKELQKFRSEFFGRLSELLEDREEIRVVGDRFVFQSELLFEKGSANLGQEGNEQLKQLFITLDEIAQTIPNDINWVLQNVRNYCFSVFRVIIKMFIIPFVVI